MSLSSNKEADQRGASGANVLVQVVLGTLLVTLFFGLVMLMYAGR